jgi:hypothetical protein
MNRYLRNVASNYPRHNESDNRELSYLFRWGIEKQRERIEVKERTGPILSKGLQQKPERGRLALCNAAKMAALRASFARVPK